MKHAGADDLVEAGLQFVRALDGKPAHLKIVQLVFSFQLVGTANARFAEVDTHNSRSRPTHRVLGRLRRPTTSYQNRLVFAIGYGRPKQMVFRAAFLRVSPEPIFLEAIDRRRIRV